MLAIDLERRLFYEGSAYYGHAIWPSPVVTIATVLDGSNVEFNPPESSDLGRAGLIFREDSFDPVTRIRRGRFYNRDDGVQPQEWHVQQHPMVYEDASRRDHRGYFRQRLYGYHIWPARSRLRGHISEQFVALGIRDAVTIWRVIGIEHVSTGEDLVTLKARSNMGALPEIALNRVPGELKSLVSSLIDTLADTLYRAGPESVIDRCRDAAAGILGAWLSQESPTAPTKDLAQLVRIVRNSTEKVIAADSAEIIARLHARAKPNEQLKRSLPAISEMDAELSVACVSAIMREIAWADT